MTSNHILMSGAPEGFDATIVSKEAQQGGVIHVARDAHRMQAMRAALEFFAPELPVFHFPAWDCLPFDRASPALSVSARRLAALQKLQHKQTGPQLLVTTINAVLQRVLTPFRVRESVREFRVGTQIGHESLAALLTRQGYSRTDTVADAGEFAVRGSISPRFSKSFEPSS